MSKNFKVFYFKNIAYSTSCFTHLAKRNQNQIQFSTITKFKKRNDSFQLLQGKSIESFGLSTWSPLNKLSQDIPTFSFKILKSGGGGPQAQ